MARLPSRGFVASMVLPPRSEMTRSPTEVAFAVKQVIRASADDSRQLGVAFSQLHISPATEADLDAEPPFIQAEAESPVLGIAPHPHIDDVPLITAREI